MPTWRGNTYRFTVTAANATAGATYTNNGQTFTVTDTITAGTVLYAFGTGAPLASGTLTLATGTGDATITFSANTAPNTAWGTATNWLENAVPTGTTDAIFDANSRDCTMGANRSCRDLTFTAYPNTLTVATFTLTVNRNITLQSDISSRISGTTGTLQTGNVGGTITSNGGTWPLNFSMGTTGLTFTLADNFTVSGSTSLIGSTYNSNSFFANGNFSTSGGTAISGTTNFFMTGTGTLTTAGGASCNLEITSTAVVTVSGNIVTNRRFVISPSATVNSLSTANLTVVGSAGTTTVDISGRTVQDFTTNTGTGTYSILNSFTCRNFSLIQATYNGPTAPSTATITITGDYFSAILNGTNGTLDLVMTAAATGTGTITTGANITALPLTLNAGANTIAMAGTVNIRTGAVFTRTSGNMNPGTSTVQLPGGVTSATINNIIFNNLTVVTSTTTTITQNVANTINGTLTCQSGFTTVFAGTAGWTAATFSTVATGATTITLQAAVEYRVTSALTLQGSSISTLQLTLQSSSGSVRAIFTLDNGATQSVYFVRAIRIDSGNAQTIWDVPGNISPLLTDTINWNPGTRPAPIAYSFIG